MDLPKLSCGGCRKCCLADHTVLQPQDDVTQYKTNLVDGDRVLAKGKDGNCVYLGRKGCQIHGRQPVVCRAYDCRKHFLTKEADGTFHAAIDGTQMRHALLEGRRRVNALRASAEAAVH